MKVVTLSTGMGEIMAPQTLVTALIIDAAGHGKIDAGALHGRSEVEREVEWVGQRTLVPDAQVCWFVWIAIQLDASNTPVRYTGLSVSEVWVDPTRRLGYKSVAGHVNRMAEAMRGGVNVGALHGEAKRCVKQELVALSRVLWDQSAESLQQVLDV